MSRRHCVFVVTHCLQLLQFSILSSKMTAEPWEKGCDREFPLRAQHSLVSYSLHLRQLWAPVLTSICRKRTFFNDGWDVLIHEYQSLGVGSILCAFSRNIVWSPQEGDHRVPYCDYSALYRTQRAHLWSLEICQRPSPRRRSSTLIMLRGGSTRMWCWTKLTLPSQLFRGMWGTWGLALQVGNLGTHREHSTHLCGPAWGLHVTYLSFCSSSNPLHLLVGTPESCHQS